MSPAGQRLWSVIGAATRQVRRDGLLATGSIAAATVPLALVAAWLLGGLPAWLAPSPVPLAVVAIALMIAVAAAAWVGRRWVAGVDDTVIAAAAEARRNLPAGSVRGVLELSRALPAGTSAALYERAEAELARELAGAAARELSGEMGERARRRRQRTLLALGGLGTLTVALGFISPERSRLAWAPLLHPVAHLSPPPLPPLIVRPGDAEVPRGGVLELAIEAPGRTEVLVRWRAAGDVPRQRRLEIAGARAATRLSGIDAPLEYWVISPDGASSDTFEVTPLDPLLVSDLVVDVVYPAYLNRQPERFEGEVPPLEVPAGTELRIRGRATRRLRDVVLLRGDGAARLPLEVTADRFSGRWKPRRSGVYQWSLTDQTGGGAAATPPPLEIALVGDEAPRVEITFPGMDTLLGPELRQVVVADAQDDHGLRGATLVSWRISALGDRDPAVEQPLALESGADRAILQGLLEAGHRRLLPGDVLHYFVRVVDNSPARQVGVSQTYTLRLPSMSELRERAGTQTESMVEDAASLARSAQQLEQATRDLARRTARSSRGSSGGQPSRPAAPGGQPGGRGGERADMGYQELEQARQVLERQASMVERIEGMRARTEALERAMQAAGLQDPALQERLQELRQLYDQILTPELKKQLEDLRNALEEMDPEQVQQALEQLAKQQNEFRERVEQSLELLRRAAAEQQMNALAKETKELATQQQALAEAMKREGSVSPERAAQQEELSERAEALEEQMQKLQQQLAAQGESRAAEQAGRAAQQVQQGQQAMEQAARQAQQRQGQQAGQAGEQAASRLDEAARTLESARQAMAESWRQEAQETVEQAANEALALAQRQSELLQQMQQAQQQPGQPASPQQDPASRGQSGQQNGSQAQPQNGQQSGQQSGQQNGRQSGQQNSQQSGQQSAQQGGQQGGQQGQQAQQGGGQQAGSQDGQGGQTSRSGQRPGGESGPGGSSGVQQMRSEQMALQQGLQALGRNLAEAGRRSAMVNNDVGAALGRAMLSMQQTLNALEGSSGQQGMPVEEAQQTVEALNRLALALLANGEQIGQAQSGTGLQEALQQLAELAKQQGSLNGQANSLLPLDLGARAMGDQLARMAREQRVIAKKLGGVNDMVGGQDDLLGKLDELAREAEAIARELGGGRLSPELLARQERLFHRLLDAGRTLEREELSEQRIAERPGNVGTSRPGALDPTLLEGGPRFPVPGPEALRALPPAYRRLILEYFDRLNRSGAEPRDTRRDAAPGGRKENR